VTPIRVLIVRGRAALAWPPHPGVELAGSVGPGEAAEAARRLGAEVVVVDLRGDLHAGLTAIRAVLADAPRPVLGLVADDHAVASARAEGALDTLVPPAIWDGDALHRLHLQLRTLRGVPVITRRAVRTPPAVRTRGEVVVIGASTGGPEALTVLLSGLRGLSAPLLVVQHIAEEFVAGLASSLSQRAGLPVEVATHGSMPISGTVHLAPGGTHLRMSASGRLLLEPEPATLHRPSVDELFASVAAAAGSAAVGVLLTGMGADGAQGLRRLRDGGAWTIAQDGPSSAVNGMPAAAVALGAAVEVLPLGDIANAVRRRTRLAA
jgi:two-component system chemotaxis response regulator CheB